MHVAAKLSQIFWALSRPKIPHYPNDLKAPHVPLRNPRYPTTLDSPTPPDTPTPIYLDPGIYSPSELTSTPALFLF